MGISKRFVWSIICCLISITLRRTESIEETRLLDYDLEEFDIRSNVTDRGLTLNPLSYHITSPYQVLPGSYRSANNYYYDGGEYNAKSIYAKYLNNNGAYYRYNQTNCLSSYGTIPIIGPRDIVQAFAYANNKLRSTYQEYQNFSHYSHNIIHKEMEGHIMELASEYFAKFKCFSKYQLSTYLHTIPVGNQYHYMNKQGDQSCLPFYNENYKCYPSQKSKYRTIDGSCNNLRFPYWGRSFTCHIRLLPADYSDGIQSFRMSKNGELLPNPRTISNYVAISKDLKAYYTSLVLAWGQFINHDITNTETYKSDANNKIDCCIRPHYKCSAIPTDVQNDYLKTKYNTKCFNFIRSSPCPLCKMGPREQLNGQTSFLDGSAIYGATLKESTRLRSFQKGQLLAFSDKYGNAILPASAEMKPCSSVNERLFCFKAGDNRVNQHPLLLTIHTLLMRNHNHHAYKLSFINPKWNDEKLFQEARRITIAEIQHVTFNEYLPIIMGPLLMNYYNLNSLQKGYSYYEENTDPSSWNEFISAASRYGHSQIKDHYRTKSTNYGNHSFFALSDNFFEPSFAYDGLLEDIVRGSVDDVANTIDPYYSHTAKNFIMKLKSQAHGIDLVATNIQRGRDHGIPGYVHYLKACFNYEAKSWSDLKRFIPNETLMKLRHIYRDIEDIDLYIAGIAERHFVDAAIGPTFGCLVGIQFYHLKFGDRYFYEHGGQSGSFTPAQLDNIRKSSSMAHLLCRNARLQMIQTQPFYLPSRYNQQIDCRSYPELNYLLWKE